jgi:hypothetical protein
MRCFRHNFPGGSLYQILLNLVPELALTGNWPLPGTPFSYGNAAKTYLNHALFAFEFRPLQVVLLIQHININANLY